MMIACSAMMLAAAAIGNPGYTPKAWHTFLLTVLLLIIHAAIASFHTRFLARFNQVGTTINLIALFVFFIVVPAASINTPKTNPSSQVWGTLTNGTVWPDGVAVLMSFLGVIWTMSGYDAPFHLSEECSNANIASPRAIVMTSTLGGILGWFVMLVIGYTVQDSSAVLGSDLGQPMGSFLLQVLGQKGGVGMFSLVIISCFFMGQGCMVASSRVIYAYSRDGAIPGSWLWATVNPWTRTPVYAGMELPLHLLTFSLVRLPYWSIIKSPCFWRPCRYRRRIFDRCDCTVYRIHHPGCYSSYLCSR
jgi:amino acid transporter